MLMLRDVSTRIATTASRASASTPRDDRPEQKDDERQQRDEAQGDEDAGGARRQRAPVVGEPRDEAGGGDDEGESPPGERMREGHAGLLLPGQRLVVSGDHLPVVVWHALAAAGAEAILERPARAAVAITDAS